MNVLLLVPLNEPYYSVIEASKTAWSAKLNATKKIKRLSAVYPSGVLSIAAYVAKNLPGTTVRILDLNIVMNQLAEEGFSFESQSFEGFLRQALGLLGDFSPDVVGISALFCSAYQDLKPEAAFLRRHFPRSLLVCGGHLASTIYDRVYEDDVEVHALAFGEGELPFIELLRAVNAGDPAAYLAASPCWVTREKMRAPGGFVPAANLIVDLDEIPPYDLGVLLFPHAYYESSRYTFMPEAYEERREMVMFSTRGCPHNCLFCASSQVHGKRVRMHSAARVESDIRHYRERYGIDKVVFYDDHILIKKARALQILGFFSPESGVVAGIINPAFFAIDADIAAAMKRAGVRSAILSIESGNENTFKHIVRKPASLQKANEAVDFLHREGIIASTNVMIGLPGETEASIQRGLEYLLTTSFNWFSCYVAAPLPGSDFYKTCLENRYFVESGDILKMDFKKCVIRTPGFEPAYIERMAYEMNLTLNYVNNYDMRVGNDAQALMLFEKVISVVMDTHAFAYYFAAKCCRRLGREEAFRSHKAKYEEMIGSYPFWREWAAHFKLEPLA
jgi:anaerobic magnesium-protoporphyrin IX monomethyl ester cyclase